MVVFLAWSSYSGHPYTLYLSIWQWALSCTIFVSSIPFYESVLGSLFSKLLHDRSLEGRGQSVMGAAKNIGAVLGPFTSTAIFPTSVAYILLLMGLMWFVVYCFLVIAAVTGERMLVKKEETEADYLELKGLFEREKAEIEKKQRQRGVSKVQTYGTLERVF